MKTTLSMVLMFCISLTLPAQIYLRGQLCGDFAQGPFSTYDFQFHPEQMTSSVPFKARFGGGAFAQTELGVRFRQLEVGLTYSMHGGSSASYFDSTFSNRGDTILTSRNAVFTSLSRAGIMATYYFGKKKWSPLVFAGAQALIRPRFELSYRTDTLEFPNEPYRRYSRVAENYGGGTGIGYSVGAGISFSADACLSCFLKFGYTVQQWKPTEFVFAMQKAENKIEYTYAGTTDHVVKLNTVFFAFGGTYYFGVKEEEAMKDPLQD